MIQERFKAVKVSSAQTTAQISVSGDAVPGRDYLSRVIVSWLSSAGTAVNIFDGSTSLALVTPAAVMGTPLTYVVDIGCYSKSTKGFNITTGSSVSAVAIGYFG